MGASCSSQTVSVARASVVNVTSASPPGVKAVAGSSKSLPHMPASELPAEVQAAVDRTSEGGMPTFDVKSMSNQARKAPKDLARRAAALNRCFDALDKDKSGHIDMKEMKQYLFRAGTTMPALTAEATDLMAKMDTNKDDLVSREEFVVMMDVLTVGRADEEMEAWVAEVVFTATSKNATAFGNILGEVLSKLNLTKEHIASVQSCFKALGPGPSGCIEAADLKRAIMSGREGSAAEAGLSDEQSVEEYVASLMRKLDVNQDGKVAEQEFYVLFADMRQMIGSDSRFDRMLDAVLKECSEGNQHEVLTTLAILDDQ